ncbi:MAG: NAD(+) synthase [Thermoplasmatota archaeon]
MDLTPKMHSHTSTIIEQFISERFLSSGKSTVLIGLSGGLDSSVVAKLAADAIGPDKVKAFFMPHGRESTREMRDAEEAAAFAGVALETVDISPIVGSIPLSMEGMVLGNAKARARMLFLYSYANKHSGMVLGTSNKTELLLGYFTKFGDGAADIYPIGDLFKTQVIELAGELKIPKGIVAKPPTAGLLKGQTDEGELGLPYPVLDQILTGYIADLEPAEIMDSMDLTSVTVDQMDRSGFEPPLSEEQVKRVFDMVRGSMHKRAPLAVPKVGGSTVGIDLRERW